MKRIIVMGCSGSGKSTLAKALGAELDLPVHHLDSYYWQPGWQDPDPEVFGQKVQELISHDEWIIDGSFSMYDPEEKRYQRADCVIYFDRSVWLCLYRVIKRVFQYRNRTRPDMGADCPEKVDWEFLSYVWSYRRNNWTKLLDRAARHGHAPIILKSDPDISELVAQINALSASSQTSRASL